MSWLTENVIFIIYLLHKSFAKQKGYNLDITY